MLLSFFCIPYDIRSLKILTLNHYYIQSQDNTPFPYSSLQLGNEDLSNANVPMVKGVFSAWR